MNEGLEGPAQYLQRTLELLQVILAEERDSLRSAAECVARTIDGGGLVHAFGTGHSHILAEELFYRAGGLIAVNPILVDSLMLHHGAIESTRLERTPGVIDEHVADLVIGADDTLIVASNSGGNVACVELADRFVEAGADVVAVISRAHAVAVWPDAPAPLVEIATVVIDNHGVLGDAAVRVPGLDVPVGPTSTVAAASIANAIVVGAAELLAAAGHRDHVLRSANTIGGDEFNERLLAPYRGVIRSI